MHELRWLLRLSLVTGPVHLLLTAGAVAALAFLLFLRRDRRWWQRVVPLGVVAAAVLVAGLVALIVVARPWPDPLPPTVLGWIGVGVFGIVLAVLGARRQRWVVRVLASGAALLAVLGAIDAVDTVYGSFPTVATALQLAPYDAASARGILRREPVAAPAAGPLWEHWRPPPDLPPHGAVIQVPIPAPRSHFHARPGWVYVPPAYLTAHRPLLPVLVLVGGQPGSPRDWLDGGEIASRLDRWAAAHAGLAPVVVMPDALGGETGNPLCMDSALGRADTYLSQDVPAWATRHLEVDPDHARWAVGGFSYGGTCALQLATAHPDVFPTFLDESGQAEPSLGDRALTVAATFHGNTAAFDAVDPLYELRVRRYPGSAGYLVVGEQEGSYRIQTLAIAGLAGAAGMSITVAELPGRHSWSVWRPAFGTALPWLAAHLGLTA